MMQPMPPKGQGGYARKVMDTAAERDRLKANRAELAEALGKALKLCGYCDGTGKAYTREDEMAVGCSPGQSEIPCAACEGIRAVLWTHGPKEFTP